MTEMDKRTTTRMTGNPCRGCGYRITWAEQRRQYARAIQRYGVTPEAAKELMPRCGKCLTRALAEQPDAFDGACAR
jgi:hypothetical protein